MKIKFINYVAVALIFFVVQAYGQNRNAKISNIKIDSIEIDNKEIIKTLKEFYTAYMLSCLQSKLDLKTEDSILNKYVTKNLQMRIKRASLNNDLDNDPFINAQDCTFEGLKTLNVTSDTGQKGVYNVCYTVESEKYCIKLSVIKVNNNYMINNILGVDFSE